MFDAVLQQREVPARRIGAGLVLAVAAHAGAAAVAVYFSARHVIQSRRPTEVVFKAALPAPPPPPPPPLGGGAPKPRVDPPKKPVPVKKPDTMLDPRHKDEPEKPKEPDKEPEKPAETAAPGSGVPGGDPHGVPGGDPLHGVPGGTLDGGVPGGTPGSTGTAAAAPPPTNVTLPFGEGMTRPSLIGGAAQPSYPREALEAKVEGKVIARCTITVAGTLTGCRILKSLPFLDQAVLTTLAGQRYTPVMYQGHPQSVFYTLTFRFKLP